MRVRRHIVCSHRFLWTVRQLVARTPCPYNVCGGRCAAICLVLAVGFQSGGATHSPTGSLDISRFGCIVRFGGAVVSFQILEIFCHYLCHNV